MIRVGDDALLLSGMARASELSGVELVPAPGRLAFASLWIADGPGGSRLLRAQAARQVGARWESWSSFCRPEDDEPALHETETLGQRIASEFGLHAPDLAGAPPASEVLPALHAFLDGRVVVTSARQEFLGCWNQAPAPHVEALDLAEIAGVCLPGSLASEGSLVAARLLGREPEGGPGALAPDFLRAALGVLAARVLRFPAPELAVVAHALAAAARALARAGAERAAHLELVLSLLEHPSAWKDPARALEPESVELVDRRLSAALREYPSLPDALAAAGPGWRRDGEPASPPAARCAEERVLGEADRRHVDEIFQEILPRSLAERETPARYRIAQHGVARVIAEGFGRKELRLVHAPTGTGKTLAYLVPVALWALRQDTRVGIATFTRVLQEQAMAREVPVALELLRRAADVTGIRVAVLKGRENYLCWRALTLQLRDAQDAAGEHLAWAALALFALQDERGDLDRFSASLPAFGLDPDGCRRAAERMLRAVRAETGCCTVSADRAACGADCAWRAAERAHVILTNHALALARRDFFHHVVFDECEHLHDVALNAFSTSVGLGEVAATLARLEGESRTLRRSLAALPEGNEASLELRRSAELALAARAALAELRGACSALQRWREERAREGDEEHRLFTRYVSTYGEALLASHGELVNALRALDTSLARLHETLSGSLAPREAARLRRRAEVLRSELVEQHEALVAWIPRDSAGRPAFGLESFHDLETTSAGDALAVTRVLLPHEHLGRHYYPMLAGAVLLSAASWLRGGFDSAARYLGLARAAEPAADEEREPFPVESFRAPETFDYSRVLVAVPRDAPPVNDKARHLDYTTRFLAFLAERTRGRLLALFTNAEDLAVVGRRLAPHLAARRVPCWWQGMPGTSKEEIGRRFRARVDSVLLGLDAFWHGADFPGPTLEYLVIVRLPFGVPDRFHRAQCGVLGAGEQRRTIYLPRALSRFRQGFGRLMRTETDRGCAFVLDRRALDPRHRVFLGELPVRPAGKEAEEEERSARLVLGDTDRCIEEALAHMGMKAEVRRQGRAGVFEGWDLAAPD